MVGYITHQIRAYNLTSKVAAKIEYIYADGTEQETPLKLIHTNSSWTSYKHLLTQVPRELVSGVKVWLSDVVEGNDYSTVYEKLTTVWSIPIAESVVFADGSSSYISWGYNDFVVAKTVDLSDEPRKLTGLVIY